MAQRTQGLWSFTQVPMLYAAFQSLLGGDRTRHEIVTRFLRPAAGARVLDIGCGSASLLPDLGAVDYVGLDTNAEHIREAKARHGAAGKFFCGTLEALADAVGGPFDLAMCIGVLHHLDDDQVRGMCSIIAPRLVSGGRFVTIDPAFVDGQNPIAYWLAKADSGRNVRTPDAYAALVRPAFAHLGVTVRHDLLKVPYTHAILEARVA